MKKVLLVVISLALALAGLLSGCKKESKDDNSAMLAILAVSSASGSSTYGGTSPIGDLIEVTIDRVNKRVTHTNYTTSQVNGPFSYSAVAVAAANGFSILNRAEIGSGNYVLFSEFPGAAVVYQIFDSSGNGVGWPVYVVTKSSPTASNYYGTAYNWMKFYIDQSSTASDMECGFAAFDAAATQGLLYGAGYSNRREAEGGTAIAAINNGGSVKIDSFAWNSTMRAFILYNPSYPNDMNYALSMTGTPSGTAVLDFGPSQKQGGALAIPQAAAKAFSAAYVGTYLGIIYEYQKASGSRTVMIGKIVISSDGTVNGVKVYGYADKTSTGTPIYGSSLQALADFATGPGGTPVYQQFQTVSGNAAASSTVVQNAHLCLGSFIATDAPGKVVVINFDPSGRFAGYTMFDNRGTAGDAADDIIRFGFAIKDAGYTDSY